MSDPKYVSEINTVVWEDKEERREWVERKGLSLPPDVIGLVRDELSEEMKEAFDVTDKFFHFDGEKGTVI